VGLFDGLFGTDAPDDDYTRSYTAALARVDGALDAFLSFRWYDYVPLVGSIDQMIRTGSGRADEIRAARDVIAEQWDRAVEGHDDTGRRLTAESMAQLADVAAAYLMDADGRPAVSLATVADEGYQKGLDAAKGIAEDVGSGLLVAGGGLVVLLLVGLAIYGYARGKGGSGA